VQWVSPEVSPEFIKRALEETKLHCIGTQDYYDEVAPNLDGVIKMNELWGGQYICVSRIPGRYHSLDGCVSLASEINQLAERIETSGKTLAFHPIYSDYETCNGKALFDVLLENCSDKLQVCLDVYHVMKAGYDPVDWIKKLKGRIP
jgi:sugar phosphate isomerase/epimerase